MTGSSDDQSRIEQGLLGAVLREPANWLHLSASGLAPEDWVAARPVLDWVRNYRERYTALPEPQLVAAQFAQWAPPPGEYAYWFDQMRRATVARRMTNTLLEGVERMKHDPEGTLVELLRALAAIQVVTSTHAISWDHTAPTRLERYQQRMAHYMSSDSAVAGITTNWKLFNEIRIGWLPGELIGVYARPSVGKTWVLAQEAVNVWLQGLRVLFVSPEMPASQINLRFDSLVAGAFGIRPWSHRQLMAGHPAMERSYHQLVEHVSQSDRWWTVDSEERGAALTVDDIAQLADRHQPDMVFVDGLGLLAGHERRQEWERFKHNCYGLKTVATVRNLPIMVTHQASRPQHFNPDAKKKGETQSKDGAIGRGDTFEMPTLNNAYGGDALVQACNTIITMAPDPYRTDVLWYSMRKHRDRSIEGLKPRYPMLFDVDRGILKDMAGLENYDVQSLAAAVDAARKALVA